MNIVRAWKDATYRASLSAEEQAQLPANPAGAVELSDAELETIYGAHGDDSTDIHVDTGGVVCLKTVNADADIISLLNLNALSNDAESAICF